MWNPRRRFKTVNDMWKESVRDETPLLSTYPGEFWSFYRSNYVRFDALFRQMFLSFTYFLQDNSEDLSTVTANFTDAVYNHLLLNHKKYDELYRMELLDDEDYSFNVNYDVHETFSGTSSGTISNTIGSRTDNSSVTYGQRQDTTNSTTGGRTDNTTLNKGSHTDNLEHDVSPDDSEDFFNHRKDTNVYGAEQDTTNFTQGSQTDSDTFTKGSETDSSSATTGQQINSGTSSGTEGHTLNKKGIVGNITPAKLLEQHENLWRMYEFYKYIFKQISEDLLLV